MLLSAPEFTFVVIITMSPIVLSLTWARSFAPLTQTAVELSPASERKIDSTPSRTTELT